MHFFTNANMLRKKDIFQSIINKRAKPAKKQEQDGKQYDDFAYYTYISYYTYILSTVVIRLISFTY